MDSYFSKMGRPPLVMGSALCLWDGSFREKLWDALENGDRLVAVEGDRDRRNNTRISRVVGGRYP